MSVLSIISRANGGIIEFNTGSIANPVEFQGLLLDTEGAVYATIEAPEYFENGLGFKDGALCVTETPYENISNGLPFFNGSLCVSSGEPTHYNNGIPFGDGGISSGGLNPPIFSGTYWYSPLSNNGNDTITNGSFVNQGLSIKNVDLTTGIQTIPAQTLAVFPNHSVYGNSISGSLGEPEATTQIPTDMSLWDDSTQSLITYNSENKENTWAFTGGSVNHRTFANSSVTAGLDYTLSLFVKKGETQFLQITGSSGFDTAIVVNYDLVGKDTLKKN